MQELKNPKYVIDDLCKFISDTYHDSLPHSLIIAQKFILKYQGYGKEFGLSSINKIIEDLINKDIIKP